MDNQKLIEKQKWFVNLRLGMFIHFNSATFQFNDSDIIDWEYDSENGGEPRRYPFDPKDFNPENLDCSQWAEAASLLGAKFAALTAKHHEGFCLWPTATTEYCVRNAKIKTDVVGEYFKAFRAKGILPGLYFSMLDLTRGIGRKGCTGDDVEYTKNQLTELLTCYGEIPFIIIDGWQAFWGGPPYSDMPYEEIDSHIKSIQPDCMLLNISCENNLDHTEVVFYENAAGQDVEDSFVGPGAGCNKLTDTWFWRKTDPAAELKSARWAVDKIEEMNSRNVTFILNLSPSPSGRADDNLMQRFAEIGRLYRRPADLKHIPDGWIKRN
jgi:alpha-L-fucosidase